MSYHIVNIDSAQCSLSCKDGRLVCKTGDGERSLPLEDVASIIITSFSAHIHSHLFLEAAKHGVALIICEAFKPVSLVLPANRSTDTLLSRALLDLTERTRQQLWQKTVDAKCQNQAALAERIGGTCSVASHASPATENSVGHDGACPSSIVQRLRDAAHGKKPHKEAICAKLFWQTFGSALGEEDFTRERSRAGLNALLNYGYAVLLSTVLQKLFAVGLDPTWGISHAPRERATPLAYDLMEPFRPCVDWRVFQWAKKMRDGGTRSTVAGVTDPGHNANGNGATLEVNKEFRAWVTAFPLEKVGYLDFTLEIQGVIEGVVRSFRRAVLAGESKPYKPWLARNWAEL